MHDSGPVAVFAGPGSGKTRVVTLRAARLAERGNRVLVTTFTNDATEEMRRRIGEMAPPKSLADITVSTLHALCLSMLKAQGSKFTLLIDETQRRGLAEMAHASDLEGGVREFLNRVSYLKNTGDSHTSYKHDGSYEDREFHKAWAAFERAKSERQLKEFDDLVLDVVKLVETNESFRNEWANRFSHIIVDEAQDMNRPQFSIVFALGRNHHNVMLVGDPDQSLYAFRGADTETFSTFANHRSTKVYELNKNYRSTDTIVRVADSLIRQDDQRRAIQFSSTRSAGNAVTWNVYVDADTEALALGESILTLNKSGVKFREMCVIFRVNAQSEALERNFAALEIPFVARQSGDFYSRREVSGILSYLEFFEDYADEWLIALTSVPNRKLQKSAVSELARVSKILGRTMWRHLPDFNAPDIKSFRIFQSIHKELKEIESKLPGISNAGEAIKIVRQVVGIDNWLKMQEVDSRDNDRIQNVEQLQNAASHYKTTNDYLRAVKKVKEENERRKAEMRRNKKEGIDAVTLCTGHAAKGLEWNVVFAPGWSEGLLPHRKSDNLSEERRIAYVIATRARDLLAITSLQNWNNSTVSPSPFLVGLNLSGGDVKATVLTQAEDQGVSLGGLFI